MDRQEGLFTFAHLTDPHLPLRRADLGAGAGLLNKRLTGALSWWQKRRHIHLPEVLEALVADIKAHRPQHVVLTGDVVNIALPVEFQRARAWISNLGPPEEVTLVPGNHDLYVDVAWEQGPGLWEANFAGDGDGPAGPGQSGFPFVRKRGPAVFVGVSTALPLPVFSAAGRIGTAQLERLEALLLTLAKEDRARIVVLHHPPGKAGASRRRGLLDRTAFQEVLARAGADLIIHGHTHSAVFDHLAGASGAVPILAPASASSSHAEYANWHAIAVERTDAGWQFHITVRGINPVTLTPNTLGQFTIPPMPNSASSS